MPVAFSILDNTLGKEAPLPGRPLFMVEITCKDGYVARYTTAAASGGNACVYNGNTYKCRIKSHDVGAIQAMASQGYDIVPSFGLTLEDSDASIWGSDIVPHGWRGAKMVVTFTMWDVPSNSWATDSFQWRFILGKPGWNNGTITVDSTSKMNMGRIKLPSVPVSRRCPWVFPQTYLQRVAALNDPTSIYYQDGYSPDVSGGVGNLRAGTTLSGSYTAGATSITVGSVTGTLPAVPFQFTVGSNEFLCTLVAGSTWTVAGGQNGTTDANALISAAVKVPFVSCDYTRATCIAQMGNPAGTLSSDGDITKDKAGNSTGRFGGITWIPPVQWNGHQYVSGGPNQYGFNPSNQAIFNKYFNFVYGTQLVNCTVIAPVGDPNSNRSECVVCVAANGPAEVQMVIVNGVEITYQNSDQLNTWRYVNQGGRNGSVNQDAIYKSGGVANGDPYGSLCCIEIVVPFELAAQGSTPTVQAIVIGPPVATFISAGGGAYTVGYQASTNPVWHLLDLLTWGNWAYNAANPALGDIDLGSFVTAAAYCDVFINYLNLAGATDSHSRFRSSFCLDGTQRQSLAQIVTALRNSANLMLGPNSSNGLLACQPRMTLADQQPSVIPGSNYNTAVSSETALGVAANGHLAYLFADDGSIVKKSFKTTPRPIADTPNRVNFAFQDEDNNYQQDSISQVDPDAFVCSGNMPVDVSLQINAIPNFDQASRISNIQLSEPLRGNSRDDADGTEYFEFQATVKAAHLAGMMGAICGIEWQQLSL